MTNTVGNCDKSQQNSTIFSFLINEQMNWIVREQECEIKWKTIEFFAVLLF